MARDILKARSLGIIVRIRGCSAIRMRHEDKHLDFDPVLLRTRRSGVRVPPGAPLLQNLYTQ